MYNELFLFVRRYIFRERIFKAVIPEQCFRIFIHVVSRRLIQLITVITYSNISTLELSRCSDGLRDGHLRFRFPAGGRDFSLLHSVPTDCGAHPDPSPMVTGLSFPGGKVVWAWSWPFTAIKCRDQEWWSSIPLLFLWLYSPFLGLGRFFSYLIRYTVGRTPWTGNQPVARHLPKRRITQTQKWTHTIHEISMPWVGFEFTVLAFEDSSCLRPRGHCDRQLYVYSPVYLHGTVLQWVTGRNSIWSYVGHIFISSIF
jgi:hypothetical protein